ncbi:hypothetical protein DEU56DRAFT_758402 [Suillus clintonianus]|uniref:uncharacterized protein n=1 Tax=Suillus clintonianus TaxID=1904413 RepID=UPI001B8749DF|nr:uncharacterized protein DEU56DRAFT_758402 [Suillus clintonianus]KAG2128583.1 hypothetical protein DEU56DRAFT_758402 [Suillus clintonianus]
MPIEMPVKMERHISTPDVPLFYHSTPRKAQRQRMGKVRSFLPGFVDRAIFRTKPVPHRDTAGSPPKVDLTVNVDSLAAKTHNHDYLQAQLISERMEAQKLRVANRGLRTSLAAVNKERKATPQALNQAQRYSCTVQEQLDFDRKAMQSEVSKIIQSYDSKLRDMNELSMRQGAQVIKLQSRLFDQDELNMRQGAQVIKLQSKLFDQDEHIAHLESLEVSDSVIESLTRKTSVRNLEGVSQLDSGSQGRSIVVQAIAERESKPQSTEPAVAAKRNSTTKHEPERTRKLVKQQREAAHDASVRRKDDDPFNSEPNLAPNRRIRSVLADARDCGAKTPATISGQKDARRKKDEQHPSQAYHGHQTDLAAFQDIQSLPGDARECGARTLATISELKDARCKKDEDRPSKACHDHQAEFAAYQDQIAALTSERDTLSRELRRSTRMANSNACLLNSVELQAQQLLYEHDALVIEHQQEKAHSQQQIRQLEAQLEETTASAFRARDRCEVAREELLEVKEQLRLERIRSAQNHGDHLDEMLILSRKNAEQANLIETLNTDFAEQHTTIKTSHIHLDLENNAQAIMKRKLRKMEIAFQHAQENIELLHVTSTKAQGNIFRRLSNRFPQNGPSQVLHRGSPPATQEIVKNEKAQSPLAASSTSSPPTSAHEVNGVPSQHTHRTLSCPPENPPITKPSPRDVPNDTLDVSTASILSDGGVDLLLEPSRDVSGEGNGPATLCSMLSAVRMYAPNPIRGPPEIQPRRRNVDPPKILPRVYPNDMVKVDGVTVGQTYQGHHFIFDETEDVSSILSFSF